MRPIFKSKKVLLAVAVAAATLASGAQAADLSFAVATSSSGPFQVYGDSYTYAPNGSTGAMGMWQVSATNPASSFLAFCIEPFVTLPNAPGTGVTSGTYTGAAYANANASQQANVQELYDRYYGEVSSGSAAASRVMGFQLALWNLQNGTPTTDWTLMVSGQPATDAAAAMVASVITPDTVARQYSLTQWSSVGATNFQDVLQAAPVPEPATYALMLAGVAMVGTIARRRSAA